MLVGGYLLIHSAVHLLVSAYVMPHTGATAGSSSRQLHSGWTRGAHMLWRLCECSQVQKVAFWLLCASSRPSSRQASACRCRGLVLLAGTGTLVASVFWSASASSSTCSRCVGACWCSAISSWLVMSGFWTPQAGPATGGVVACKYRTLEVIASSHSRLEQQLQQVMYKGAGSSGAGQ